MFAIGFGVGSPHADQIVIKHFSVTGTEGNRVIPLDSMGD